MISGLVLQCVDFGNEITNTAVPLAAVGVGAITGTGAIWLGHERGHTKWTVVSGILLALMFVAVLVSIFSSQLFGAGFNATWMNVFIGAGVVIGGGIFLTGTIVNANKTYQTQKAEEIINEKAHNIMAHVINNMTGERDVSNTDEEAAGVAEDLKSFSRSQQEKIFKAAEEIGREKLQKIVEPEAEKIYKEQANKEFRQLKWGGETSVSEIIARRKKKAQREQFLKSDARHQAIANHSKKVQGSLNTILAAVKPKKNERRRLVAPLHRLMEQINATA